MTVAGYRAGESVTHAVKSLAIERDRHSEPEFQFRLTTLCGDREYVAELDFTKDAAVSCSGCMAVAGVR